MFCPNCGKQLSDDSEFCEFCGAQLGGSQQSVQSQNIGQQYQQPQMGQAQNQSVQQNIQGQPVQNQQKKSTVRNIVIIVIGVIVVYKILINMLGVLYGDPVFFALGAIVSLFWGIKKKKKDFLILGAVCGVAFILYLIWFRFKFG